MRDPLNGIEYLGERYSLKDITETEDIAIQNIINAFFGDPEATITIP